MLLAPFHTSFRLTPTDRCAPCIRSVGVSMNCSFTASLAPSIPNLNPTELDPRSYASLANRISQFPETRTQPRLQVAAPEDLRCPQHAISSPDATGPLVPWRPPRKNGYFCGRLPQPAGVRLNFGIDKRVLVDTREPHHVQPLVSIVAYGHVTSAASYFKSLSPKAMILRRVFLAWINS
jgi:hypothetical protein